MDYIQLNTKTCYQIGDSIVQIDEYVKRGKALGYSYLGVCDNSLNCFPAFNKKCKENDIKPIFGQQVNIRCFNQELIDACLYIKSEIGYKNLCLLNSLNKKTFTINEISSYYEGLILILKIDSKIFSLGETYDKNSIGPEVVELKKIFNGDFYFGIIINSEDDSEKSKIFYKTIEDLDIKVLPFPEVNYIKKSDYRYYQIIKNSLNDQEMGDISNDPSPNFLINCTNLEKIYRLEDLKNFDEFVSKIDFEFAIKRGNLLQIENDNEILKEHTTNGLNKIFNNKIPQNYLGRLNHELEMIRSLNFASYFLLVEDYVSFAKMNQIKIGPGRGSAAGSLVCYALNITIIDPIRFDLSFERFLNPKRNTMPDIDIDVDDTKRNIIVEYLEQKYTQLKVCRMITYQKLKVKSALKLAAIADGIHENRVKNLTMAMSKDYETFDEMYKDKDNKKLQILLKNDYYKLLCEDAKHLISLPINTAFHAPGIIINDTDIYLNVPMSDGRTGIAQYEYEYLEEMGFLKMDLLSLSNLSFIDSIEKNIIKHGKELPNLLDLLDDPQTFKTLNKFQLSLIFQLNNSYGMKYTIKEIKPDCYDDLAAILALYRPGPKDYIQLYAQRKHNPKLIKYECELLEPILKNTYGIIVYQEQVMQILVSLGGFKPEDADLFRRAISKKNIDLMERYKNDFIEGCLHRNISKEKSLTIFNDILKFANYGFNKSHGYSYALITFQLLFYKTHFPDEFYSEAFKVTKYSSKDGENCINELRENGYSIFNPNVNFSLIDDINIINKKIYLPLSSISNNDEELTKKIIEERENHPFNSLYNFIVRISPSISKNNLNFIVSLIRAGGLDTLNSNRNEIEKNLHKFLDFATMSFPEDEVPILENISENLGERLIKEKSSLGFICSYKLKDNQEEKDFIVTDISSREFANTILCENSNMSIQVKINDSKIKIVKYDFLKIKSDFKKINGVVIPYSVECLGRRNYKNV